MTKDVISLSISVLLLFRHYISHKITFGAPSSGGVLCSACGAFILLCTCSKNGGFAHAPKIDGFEITPLALRTSVSSAISIIFEQAIHRFSK